MEWSDALPLLTVVCVPLIAVMGGAWAAQLHNTKQIITHIDMRFDAQDKKTDLRFDAADQRVNDRFDATDQHVKDRFDAADQRVNDRFDAVDQRFDAVGQRFDAVDQRFDRSDHHMAELRADLRALSNRVDSLVTSGAAV